MRLLLILLMLLVTACNPLRPGRSATPQLPASYAVSQPETGMQLPDRWWEVFADPQLNRLQQEMLGGNLSLRQALYRLEQLAALQRMSGASLWPMLNLTAAKSREHAPAINGSSTSDSTRVSLAASYEIDLWNRLHDEKAAAQLQLQAGKKETQTLLLSLSAQLAETYFLNIEQRGQLALIRQQIDRTERLLTTARDRYRAGLATAEEIYQAENSLAALNASLPPLQTALQQSEHSIALLLGRHSTPLATKSPSLPQLTAAIDTGLPASLMTKRPDIAANLIQLQAVDHELAAALAARLPAINLSATLGHSSTQLASGNVAGTIWSLIASLTQPLLDGGRRQAEVDRQQAIKAEQLTELQETLLTAVQEVETALNADQNSAARYQQLERQHFFSAQNLALSRSNYRSGLVTSSVPLAAELEHLTLLRQQLSAQREWLSSRISLARALGGEWMSGALAKQLQALNAQEDK